MELPDRFLQESLDMQFLEIHFHMKLPVSFMTWNWDIFLGKVWRGAPVGVQSLREKGQASWLPANWDILRES